MAKKPKFSMRPEEAEEGLFGNVEATIAGAKYGTYGEHGNENMIVGNRTGEDPVAIIEFEVDGVDENPVQFFSCGSATRCVPSEDNEEPASEGPFIIPAEGSSAKGLNKQTRMYSFLASLSKPAEGKLKFDSRILDEKGLDALIGLKGFFARVPATRVGEAEAGAREQTMLVCREISELPKGGKKKAKDDDETPKKGKGKAKAEADDEGEGGDDDISTEAQTIVVAALEKAGDKGIKKGELAKKCFAAASKSKNRKAIIELLQDDDFIGNDDAPWSYDSDDEVLKSIE